MELCIERMIEAARDFAGEERITQAHGAIECAEHALIEALVGVETLLENDRGMRDPARHCATIAQAKAHSYLAVATLYETLAEHLASQTTKRASEV